MKHHTLAAALAACAAVSPAVQPAAAQTARQPKPCNPAVATCPAAATVVLPEVVISAPADDAAGTIASATGTATPLRQIPQSVQVVGQDQLRAQGTRNMAQALANVPGADAQNPMQTPAFDATMVRGFAGEQMLDGMATPYNAGDPNAMNNVERIEVLKGPNALLFGGGTGTPVGGLVNVVSKMPTAAAFTELGATVGSNGLVAPSFDINRPLTADGNALFRLTGSYSTGGADVDVIDPKRYALNPTLVIGANGTTVLTLQGRLSHWQSREYQGLPAVGTVTGGFRIDRDLFIGNPDVPVSYSNARSLTATLDHQFNGTWSSQTKLRFAKTDFRENVQLIFGNAPDAPEAGPSAWKLYATELFQTQHEVSLTSHLAGNFATANATHKLLVGVDASRLSDEGAMMVDMMNPLGPVDLTKPGGWPPFVGGTGTPMSDGDNTYKTAGAFVQVQSSFGQRLHLLGGLRLAHLAIDNRSPSSGRRQETSATRLLPRLGVVYDLTPTTAVFAGYAEGMKGNPFAFQTGTPRAETSRQAEIGVKFDNGPLTGSVAAFQITRKNALVGDPMTNGMTSIAEGHQRARGIEADVVWQPAQAWKISANYALTDAVLTRDVPGGATVGTVLPFVSRHAGGVWVNYDMTDATGEGWTFGGGINARSSAHIGAKSEYRVPGHATADLAVGYRKGGLSADLAVRNIFDRDYVTAYKYMDGRVAKGDGRTIQFSLTTRF